MLSQRVLKTSSLHKIMQSSFLPISTSCIYKKFKYDDPVSSDLSKDPTVGEPKRKLKEWRKTFKGKEPMLPINSENSFFQMFRTEIEFTPWGLKKHLKKKIQQKQLEVQKYNPEKYELLGFDLALAYFIISIGGKVKFKGSDQWISFNFGKKSIDLPDKFDSKYIISEIDASDCIIHYEGLENFKNCPRVIWASFARCEEIDDWCIDRIASYLPFIEYLDLSDCCKVSERGLEALYKTSTLRTLIVTNHYKSAAFELTCMMLEDVVSGLRVDIKEPKEKMKPPINEE
ncbi:distal membrane-arm assembly complex protein 2 [Phymastichus coffea]|uniref:distal membrane-arm assembly complex protein 2 n=1 Tax=Phymastichus coffea TaxID=108790 RepID=UPI00273CE8B9|nr:distal membrane-arm assembly complex protein 2 [Phymastichus coffea]